METRPPESSLRILFVLRHALNLRNYEAAVRDLSARGHRVHLAFTPFAKAVDESLLHDLVAQCPGTTWERLPERTGVWTAVSDSARATLDLLRYYEPEYADAEKLRRRAARKFVGPLRRGIVEAAWVRDPAKRARVVRALTALEAAVPGDPAVREVFERLQPDLLLVTPLVDMTYNQFDYVKVAKESGVPSALCVASWDNLTNKGSIQVLPDRVVVWNDKQRGEAVALHGVPSASVRVTGAQLFDQWFEAEPTTTREQFCSRLGFDPSADILLYVCSSTFIAPHESRFVDRWVRQVRASAIPRVRHANILVRPHPAAAEQWKGWRAPALHVAVWPSNGAQPIDVTSKADYFDSLFHADAVVGVNTSAFIEAGIVGRRTLTVTLPEFRGTQGETLHFHHLVDGGLLETSPDLPQHEQAVGIALAAGRERTPAATAFLESFVRPHGLNQSAGLCFVQAIEELAVEGRRRPVATSAPVLRALVLPLAVLFKLVLTPTARLALRARRARRSTSMSLRSRSVKTSVRVGRRAVRRLGLAEPIKEHVLPHVLAAAADPVGVPAKVPPDELARRAMKSTLKSVLAGDERIVVGPWLSEVGFEVLYWVPFLRWLVEHHEVDPARLTVVSRGGVASWYDGIGNDYVDIFDIMTTDEFRQHTTDRWADVGGQKQMAFGQWDEVILRKAGDRLGWDGGPVLHPSVMYSLFRQFWKGRTPINHVLNHTRFRVLDKPHDEDLVAHLPERYTAVKFYFRPSFPDTPANRDFVQRTITALAEHDPVVLLNTGLHVDDHLEFSPETAKRVIPLLEGVPSERNLHAQSVAISRAEAFVGTYGGLSYLAPAYGVSSVAFASAPEHYLPAHLDLAHRAARATGSALTVLDVGRERVLAQLVTTGS